MALLCRMCQIHKDLGVNLRMVAQLKLCDVTRLVEEHCIDYYELLICSKERIAPLRYHLYEGYSIL